MPAPPGWFDKFSTTKKVKIVPPNPELNKIAEEFLNNLRILLGNNIEIERRGASTLGISGKGEIDTYVRVTPEQFDKCFKILKKEFGEPGNLEELRARFNYNFKGVEAEIILIYKDHADEIEGRKFFNYLKTHPEALKEYEQVKIKYSKVNEREYNLQKDKFIKKIMKIIK